MNWKKYLYLYKLILLIFVVIFLPITFLLQTFWKQSFDKMKANNEAYYGNVLELFTDGVVSNILEMVEHSASIIAYSKEPKSAFYNGCEEFSENMYWYYDAVNELQQTYRFSGADRYGIYYYDLDLVITTEGTYRADNFLRLILNLDKNSDDKIFDAEKYYLGDMLYSTTNSMEKQDGYLLLGYCAEMGKNHDEALIFYIVSPQKLKKDIDIIKSNEGICYYILDDENKNSYLVLNSETEFVDDRNFYGNVDREKLYFKKANGLPLHTAIYITQDSQHDKLAIFYKNMKHVIWGITILLFISCMIALSFAYRPLYKITSGIDYSGGDEFDIICGELDRNKARLNEQEMLILDLIMKHLVYGIPISQTKIKRLGMDAAEHLYCVFTLEQKVLPIIEAENMVQEVLNRFDARLFITDIQGENQSVFIAFLKKDCKAEIEKWLLAWVQMHYGEEVVFCAGKLVDKLDDIRVSYLSCIQDVKYIGAAKDEKIEENTKNKKIDQWEITKEEVLSYLEIHYRDMDLSQSQVADIFCISKYTLSRIFRNYVGVSFTDYINSKRLEYAKELLLTTDCSIKEISCMVGFINDNYFSRVFKNCVGISASEFRGEQ